MHLQTVAGVLYSKVLALCTYRFRGIGDSDGCQEGQIGSSGNFHNEDGALLRQIIGFCALAQQNTDKSAIKAIKIGLTTLTPGLDLR